MDKDTKQSLVVIAVAFVIIATAFFGLYNASGVNPPQTVVESNSMQHGPVSNFGVIDTGDMVIIKSKEKTEIVSYVEGYVSDYQTFGMYGNVIIYDRGPAINPVIHRAILWLDYNGDGTWSAPALKEYPTELWTCTSGHDPTMLSGTLTMYKLGYEKNKNPTIDLKSLEKVSASSGYITMGDNNGGFDQPKSVAGVNGLITYDQIRSVAWIEVPWLGAVKMMLNGKIDALDRYVPNTIPNLAATLLLIITLIAGLSFLFDYRYYGKIRKELKNEEDCCLFDPKNKSEK